jgi:hypothetical protein
VFRFRIWGHDPLLGPSVLTHRGSANVPDASPGVKVAVTSRSPKQEQAPGWKGSKRVST